MKRLYTIKVTENSSNLFYTEDIYADNYNEVIEFVKENKVRLIDEYMKRYTDEEKVKVCIHILMNTNETITGMFITHRHQHVYGPLTERKISKYGGKFNAYTLTAKTIGQSYNDYEGKFSYILPNKDNLVNLLSKLITTPVDFNNVKCFKIEATGKTNLIYGIFEGYDQVTFGHDCLYNIVSNEFTNVQLYDNQADLFKEILREDEIFDILCILEITTGNVLFKLDLEKVIPDFREKMKEMPHNEKIRILRLYLAIFLKQGITQLTSNYEISRGSLGMLAYKLNLPYRDVLTELSKIHDGILCSLLISIKTIEFMNKSWFNIEKDALDYVMQNRKHIFEDLLINLGSLYNTNNLINLACFFYKDNSEEFIELVLEKFEIIEKRNNIILLIEYLLNNEKISYESKLTLFNRLSNSMYNSLLSDGDNFTFDQLVNKQNPRIPINLNKALSFFYNSKEKRSLFTKFLNQYNPSFSDFISIHFSADTPLIIERGELGYEIARALISKVEETCYYDRSIRDTFKNIGIVGLRSEVYNDKLVKTLKSKLLELRLKK